MGNRALVIKCECGLPKYLRRIQGQYRYCHRSHAHKLVHDRVMAVKKETKK